MSAPLILSSDVGKLTPQAVAILGNKAVIAIDQDALGRMATLVRRSLVMDLLVKPLRGGDYAVAVLNHGDTAPIHVELHPADLGFKTNAACLLDARNLWSGALLSRLSTLQADIDPHDTVIWRIHPASSCGTAVRTGTITMTVPQAHHDIESYSRCLAAPGQMEACTGAPEETWIVTADGALQFAGSCLAIVDGKPVMQACTANKVQQWDYTLLGNLVSATDGRCLSSDTDEKLQGLTMQTCGHNQPNQIWSLPN